MRIQWEDKHARMGIYFAVREMFMQGLLSKRRWITFLQVWAWAVLPYLESAIELSIPADQAFKRVRRCQGAVGPEVLKTTYGGGKWT